MAKLTAKEIQERNVDAVAVGEGMENGEIVQKVHQGHIVDTIARSEKRAPRVQPNQA